MRIYAIYSTPAPLLSELEASKLDSREKQNCCSCRKLLLFYHCSSCYCFRARGIDSIVCSIVLSKGSKTCLQLPFLEILGVVLDSKLTFKAHIKEQLIKACAKVSALRRLRKFIPKYVMVRLYKANVLPHLEYCSPLLLGIGNAETTKMENTNYCLLRSILGFPKTVSYDCLQKIVNIKSLELRRFQSLVMLYKCLYSDGAPYISKLVFQS